MGRFVDEFMRVAFFLLISYFLLSGCSSSNDSPVLSGDDNLVNGIDSNANSDQSEPDDIPIDGETNSINESSDVITANELVDLSANGETADVPDPMIQNYTDVTFEITVPAYQSNELLMMKAVVSNWDTLGNNTGLVLMLPRCIRLALISSTRTIMIMMGIAPAIWKSLLPVPTREYLMRI